jgi:hypothetical protein
VNECDARYKYKILKYRFGDIAVHKKENTSMYGNQTNHEDSSLNIGRI